MNLFSCSTAMHCGAITTGTANVSPQLSLCLSFVAAPFYRSVLFIFEKPYQKHQDKFLAYIVSSIESFDFFYSIRIDWPDNGSELVRV